MSAKEWRFPCPCCGYYTLPGEASGTWEICPACSWEDDPVQLHDPSYQGGANRMSLEQARQAIKDGTSRFWRAPLPEEHRPQEDRECEYMDLEIPLVGPAFTRIEVRSDAWWRMFATADNVIEPWVERKVLNGWKRMHPTDFQYLLDHERCRWTAHSIGSRGEPAVYTYHSVHVRMRR